MTQPPVPPPLATGGMSTSGTTTMVKVNKPQADPIDKKQLCSAICHCKKTPGVGKDGRSLKQSCVSERLKAADKALSHRNNLKSEVNYDMTKEPPAPIMDGDIDTKGHDWLPGFIRKYWGEDPEHPKFKPGQGMVRRPDVVIVKDVMKPPTQDNIKQVVEIKFPPDTMDEPQKLAYIRIAGSDTKLVEMGPEDCNCDDPDSSGTKVPVESMSKAAAAAALLYMIITKKPPPRGVPAY